MFYAPPTATLGHARLGWLAVAPPRSFDWGVQILVRQTHLPLNFDFSSDFGHFNLKILKNLKIFVSFGKKYVKIVFSGGTAPSTF